MIKTSVDLPKDLVNEIREYCNANGKELEPFIVDLVRSSFVVEKYGAKPRTPAPIKPKADKIEETPPIEVVQPIVEEKKPIFNKDIYGE